MPAYKDEKSGKWFTSFYYKDWEGQSRKKLKRGFETKKEAITYERNFTVKMSGSK
ncbi:Arm DNA-binding domain-containing protein [Peptoniphilaceae bacterium SGI.131]